MNSSEKDTANDVVELVKEESVKASMKAISEKSIAKSV
jgi:hypothetical protein